MTGVGPLRPARPRHPARGAAPPRHRSRPRRPPGRPEPGAPDRQRHRARRPGAPRRPQAGWCQWGSRHTGLGFASATGREAPAAR
ncbi:Exonuclease SbcC [Streptomyces misionensis JCM 4497]